MRDQAILWCCLLLGLSSVNPAWCESATGKSAKALNVDQIVESNVKARGGLENWRKLETLRLSGTLLTGRKEIAEVPMVIQLKRPNKNHQEMVVHEQKLVQAFDGNAGWKIRMVQGQAVIAPYRQEDAASTRAWQDFLAPLVDHAQRNVQVEFESMEKIDDKPAYRLKLTRPDQSVQHLWIDAKSFLDVQYEDSIHLENGGIFQVTSRFRDYRLEQGLRLPGSMEVQVAGGEAPRKMLFQQIVINAPMDDALFQRPKTPPQPSPKRMLGPRP